METSNYRSVVKQLGKVDPALKKQFTKQMRALSVEVVTEARAKAGWSQKIPRAIRPTATATGVGVRVSGTVPIAVLNELKQPFRHPLFGNTGFWYSQTPRPSVRPVINANRLRLKSIGERAMKDALREAGL